MSKGGRGYRPDDAINCTAHAGGDAPQPDDTPRPSFVYVGFGGHARPVRSEEDHDPTTVPGRRAICHLMALADYECVRFPSDIAYIRHCQARALYLHEHVGPIVRISLDTLVLLQPLASRRSLLPDTWAEGQDTAAVSPGSARR